jgi:hypothetical protein|tara:strand:- start:248 stop:1195 length:948 start_codon:yes stop_codon:yes gene_type:complete
MKQSETIYTPKNANKLFCENCHFICSKPSEWNRHIMTRKHKNETNETNVYAKKRQEIYECELCENTFNSRTTFWRHKKKCYIVQEEEPSIMDSNNLEIDKELLIKMLLKNQDVIEGVILKNQDVMEKMMEIMPHVGNTTNSHNTTHNNQFNINMFLNEQCKNAMNLTDFINSLPITNETYDNTIQNGLTKSMTNLLVNGLSQLDILDRPIHCTDPARKTMYIKENDCWEKDNELLLLLHGIKNLSLKQRTLINKWQEANHGWNTDENLQSKMTTLIFHSMTNVEEDEKETNKIIRAISKNTYLTSDIKDEYSKSM